MNKFETISFFGLPNNIRKYFNNDPCLKCSFYWNLKPLIFKLKLNSAVGLQKFLWFLLKIIWIKINMYSNKTYFNNNNLRVHMNKMQPNPDYKKYVRRSVKTKLKLYR